jgi:4'-phosphopantetheinyl transferase
MNNAWNPTANDLKLSSGHIDVWKIDLSREDKNIFMHAQCLTKEEQARADKYVTGKKSREFIITRSALRNILGHVLNEDPRRFEFTYTGQGMPALSPATPNQNISFNVSHSFDMSLIAITLEQPVGIDVEKVRGDIDYEKLALRYFSDNEYKAIMKYDDEQRVHAFFATWTRKEAIVKAMGTGIASGLKSFDVSVDPAGPAELKETRWGPGIPSKWTLDTIDTGADYFACLASIGSGQDIRCWTLN